MTYEERKKAIIRAKKWIQDVIDYHQDVLNGEEPDDIEKAIFEECEVILDALEKQIPKKPINTVVAFGLSWKMGTCPVCKRLLHSFENNVGCPKCLTLIDWSEGDVKYNSDNN